MAKIKPKYKIGDITIYRHKTHFIEITGIIKSDYVYNIYNLASNSIYTNTYPIDKFEEEMLGKISSIKIGRILYG